LKHSFIDRRYYKNLSFKIDNFSSRINNFSSRINQNRRYSQKKKCFVCQKEECWSTKDSKDERETTKQKFKNRLNRFFIRTDHYIFEYERRNLSSSYSEDDFDTDLIDEMKTLIVDLSSLSALSLIFNNSNAKTFMISFDLVQNAEMMITNLVNCSLSHVLINNLHICMNDDNTSNDFQTNLKTFTLSGDLNALTFAHICMKKIDSFTYMIIDRYTSEMFYDIMIDQMLSDNQQLIMNNFSHIKRIIRMILLTLSKQKQSTFNSKSNQFSH
jgi:hypothetical protein